MSYAETAISTVARESNISLAALFRPLRRKRRLKAPVLDTGTIQAGRVMSKRFVKSFPVFSSGFEIETELSAHAVRVQANSAEVRAPYGSRGDDSASKLRTYRDGFRILITMLRLFEEMRPLQFFFICSMLLTAAALGLDLPVISHWARTGHVPRFPTEILAASIQIVAFLSLACGVILRSVGRARDEARRLVYLGIPHLAADHTFAAQ